jgi:hypothetical protein
LVFTETLTHYSETYIHDPLLLGICLFWFLVLISSKFKTKKMAHSF